jgi:hypothetical protein
MKRTHVVGIAIILVCATAIAAAYRVSDKQAAAPASAGAALYDAGGVQVRFGLHAKATSFRKAETSVVQGSDETYDVTIDDGRDEPMVVSFQATCCNGIDVQAVTDRIITLRVMPGVGIGTSEFYIADRETREIRHYLIEGSYLATTPDGLKIVIRREDAIVIQDTALGDLQRTAFVVADAYPAVALASPDGRYVAFMTWNGQHDELEKWHAYAYDLERNDVKDLGPGAYADTIHWKDATTFTTLIKTLSDGVLAEKQVGEFKLPSP